jgi:uncharacterized phage protein gp47/JayE
VAATFKSLDEALWEMMAQFWALTGIEPDAEPGAVLRTIFEAVAFEVEDITFRFDRAIQDSIPQAVFSAFGFTAQPAAQAAVTLRFTRQGSLAAPLTIPAGFRAARIDGTEYALTNALTIAINSATADGAALAVLPGVLGNTPANTITIPRGQISALQSVTNPSPAVGGTDEESLESQKARFARYLALLSKGTPAALAAAALTAVGPSGQRITGAKVFDATNSSLLPGFVEVVVDNSTASVDGPTLTAAQSALEAVRAAGVYVQAVAATPLVQPVSITLDADAEAFEPVRQAVAAYFVSLAIGQKISRENLIAVATAADSRVREVTLSTPTGDVAVGAYARAVLGTLTVV